LYQLPETAFKFMYITGSIYFSGAVGTVALGLYWKKSNTPGAYCALVLGALAPISFLIMSQLPEHVPELLKPLAESSNLPAFLSLVLGGLGMIVGSLLTQRSHPPRALDFNDME
jgi:Na+/proline symporter